MLVLRSPTLALGGVMGSAALGLPLAFFCYRVLSGFEHLGALHALALFLAAAIAADDVCVVAGHWSAAAAEAHPSARARLAATLGGSFRVVAATSITTAAAFAANLLSRLPLVRHFGAFVALLTLSLLLLVHTWLPPLLVLSDRRGGRCRKSATDGAGDDAEGEASGVTPPVRSMEATPAGVELTLPPPVRTEEAIAPKAAVEGGGATETSACTLEGEARPPRAGGVPPQTSLWRRSSSFFAAPYASWIGAHRRRILAAAGGTLVVFLALAASIEAPHGPLSPWPEWHNQARYMTTELTMAGNLGRIDVRLFWGIEPLAEEPEGDAPALLTRTPGFDICSPETQLYFVEMCALLEQAPSRRADGSLPECPFDKFEEAARKHTTPSATQGSAPAAVLPVGRETCMRVLRELWLADHGLRVYYDPSGHAEAPVAIGAWVPTSISIVEPFPSVRRRWEGWEEWLANASASAPQAALQKGFHTGGGGWVLMETAEELSASARSGFVISLVLALLVSWSVTQSFRVASAATYCIFASSCSFIAMQGAMGWPFGVIESVCSTIVVGMACDYTMHVAVSTVHLRGDLRVTLALIGPPMCAAAATTGVAGISLLPCTVLLFSRFGAFVIVTVVSALVHALVVLPALLLCNGAAFLSHAVPKARHAPTLSTAVGAPCRRGDCERPQEINPLERPTDLLMSSTQRSEQC
ncbi:hypothetical protein AB1Y20_018175 [Prymnesium parvum]|uniref:SSD domain-containing protein n=1 Tax=Prymnesium parvum TaxID=97485 RepID=A0AB34JR39_PRYPA